MYTLAFLTPVYHLRVQIIYDGFFVINISFVFEFGTKRGRFADNFDLS